MLARLSTSTFNIVLFVIAIPILLFVVTLLLNLKQAKKLGVR